MAILMMIGLGASYGEVAQRAEEAGKHALVGVAVWLCLWTGLGAGLIAVLQMIGGPPAGAGAYGLAGIALVALAALIWARTGRLGDPHEETPHADSDGALILCPPRQFVIVFYGLMAVMGLMAVGFAAYAVEEFTRGRSSTGFALSAGSLFFALLTLGGFLDVRRSRIIASTQSVEMFSLARHKRVARDQLAEILWDPREFRFLRIDRSTAFAVSTMTWTSAQMNELARYLGVPMGTHPTRASEGRAP